MVHEEKLPWEMIEEILFRVPPKSLVCFRTVSKKWNALLDDKMFLNNHKSMFQFILTTKSKIYSVNIDPEVVARELTLDIPSLESQITKTFVDCSKFLVCGIDKESVVWDPWLKQTKVIKDDVTLPGLPRFKGIACYQKGINDTMWKIHDFATNVWEEIMSKSGPGSKRATLYTTTGVSCNGNFYWVAYYNRNDPLYHIQEFEFSRETFSKVCVLPCAKNHPPDALVLGCCKGDQLSLLKQSHVTKKVEIWVTKNKINNDDDVVWMFFMEVSILLLSKPARYDTTIDEWFC